MYGQQTWYKNNFLKNCQVFGLLTFCLVGPTFKFFFFLNLCMKHCRLQMDVHTQVTQILLLYFYA